ncbi:MAG: hypothetical protein ACM30H_03350 [Clostridia bacterium]
MAYAIRPEGAHLVVTLTGLPTLGEVHAMFQEIRRQASQGIPRALVELQVQACLGAVETLDAIQELPRLGFPQGYRIALLPTAAFMHSSAEFAETVALNRGIPVRTFGERGAAVSWLDA